MNLLSYLNWHFSLAPIQILIITRNYLIFTDHFFSIGFHIKTLFKPWRKQVFTSGVGFNLSKYFETVISNLISRVLGAIVRTVLILSGIFSQILVICIGLSIFVLFIFLPIITLPLFYFLETKNAEKLYRHNLYNKILNEGIDSFDAKTIKEMINAKVGKFVLTRLLIPVNNIRNLSLPDILSNFNIKKEDFIEVLRWYNHAKDEEEEYKRSWELFNLLRVKPIGRNWAYGYTLNLDNYATDLTKEGYETTHLVGRRNEIDQIQRILSRSGQNNVIIVGDPGSGRHAVVLAFALDVFEEKVLEQLKNRRVLELNLNLLISEAKIESEIKGKVEEVLNEAVIAGNIILVIDNFEKYVAPSKEGVDLTDIFSKVFTRRDIQVIAITNREAYHKYIINNGALAKVFEIVELNEISLEDTTKVLEHLVPTLEKETKILIPFPTIIQTIKKCELIANVPYPEKAIETLKDAAILSQNQKSSILTPDYIDKIISIKTKTPVGGLLTDEKEKLRNLEDLLHQQVINQETAISEIARSLRRARLEISSKGKPIGTFLFLGPTGVGKTETAKALSRIYFGSEKLMVRIDMSQFQTTESIADLLGNTKNQEAGILVKAVRDNPFCVLLLDEIEKAGREVLDIFLTILDEGYVMDSFGRRVSFQNTLIIGTSNAGSEFIRNRINQNPDAPELSKDLTEFVLQNKFFTPEFINRFDAVVVYKPLTEDNLKKIARLMLNNLNKRLSEKQITVNITDSLIDKISKEGYAPEFGARPMKRVITEKVEDYIAKKMLDGEIKDGDNINIDF